MSVTGEALKKELTQRWFAAVPGSRLVNAYGLTETSDDTNHEVMDRVPDGDRVPLGPPVANVRVYVVDGHLQPVPLGAPGEIVFSGVCVGRGYVNDPERTRLAFLADPHREGERLYRSGDHGRWLPDGKLEFLGRRDSQVKISGFRIEIGEIENSLLRVPGVRDGAVVVAERADQSKHLVGFYAGPRQLEVTALRERLGASLPAYMVPSVIHWRENLPLTANGKIDRKALSALAGGCEVVEDDYFAPATPTERRMAAAWAGVLGIPQDHIGRLDHFFDRGGTSLGAVKLAIALDRAVSLKDVTRNPVLAELAEVLDGRTERRPGLLQCLAEPSEGQVGALVCFPYAGGNAVNFQPLAGALRGSGLAVYAVELPGHDVAARSEPFAPMAQVVGQVVDEVTVRGLTHVLLWGHSSGAAFAVESARRLTERGVDVQHVFLGRSCPGPPATGVPPARRCPGRATPRSLRSSPAMVATPGSGYSMRRTPTTPPPRTGTTACPRTATSPTRWRHLRPRGCPCPSPWWWPPTTPVRRAIPAVTVTGSTLPSTSTCTSSGTEVTTSCAPERPKQRTRSCVRPGCSVHLEWKTERNRHVLLFSDVIAGRRPATRQTADPARRERHRGVRVGGRAPACAPCRCRRARLGPGARPRAARRRQHRRRLSTPGHRADG